VLGAEQDPVAGAERARARLKELEKKSKSAGAADLEKVVDELSGAAEDAGELKLLSADAGASAGRDLESKELLQVAERVRAKLGDGGAVVLGSAGDGKAALVASFGPAAQAAGLSAAEVIKAAAGLIGGGGGGRDNVAQAGGRDPSKLGEALAAAREAVESKLA
jgi:alanyl-tRNA synthetase